jgi:hypothetical protein
MLSVIRNWLSHPVFDRDENKTRAALTLHAILMISLVSVPIYSVLVLIVVPSETQNLAFAFMTIPFTLGLLYIMRRGLVYLARKSPRRLV